MIVSMEAWQQHLDRLFPNGAVCTVVNDDDDLPESPDNVAFVTPRVLVVAVDDDGHPVLLMDGKDAAKSVVCPIWSWQDYRSGGKVLGEIVDVPESDFVLAITELGYKYWVTSHLEPGALEYCRNERTMNPYFADREPEEE